MRIEFRGYGEQDDRPYMLITINGQLARVFREQKPDLVEQGILFVGAEFEDVLPPIYLPADPEIGRGPLTLRGFLQDPQLATRYRQFEREVDAGTFQPGKEE